MNLNYVITALILLVSLVFILNSKTREKLKNIILEKPFTVLLFPIIFIGLNQWHIVYKGLPAIRGVIYGLYLLSPIAILSLANKKSQKIQFWDVIAIALLWLPVDFRIVQGWEKLNYHFISVTAVVIGFTAFAYLRKLDDIKFNFDIKKTDAIVVLSFFIAISIFLIPLGFILKFIEINPNITVIKLFPLAFINKLIITGIPEELLFRGILQNLLCKTMSNKWHAIILTSILFGFAHLENSASGYSLPNWRYAIMATIAGFWYGTAFLQSKSIMVPACIHTLVDVVWGAFLVKN